MRKALLLVAASVAPWLRADTVTLKDGTRFTGTATQVTGGKLTFTTSFAGAIPIDWASVTALTLDKPLLLILPAATVTAPAPLPLAITAIQRDGANFTVTTVSGTQSLPASSVTLLRTAAAQKAYEDSLHPNWSHDWNGSANVNFAFARGNSNTTTVGSGINVARPTLHDKTSAYFNSLYTHDGILHSTTANVTNAEMRYDHNFKASNFGYAKQDFNTDALQDLVLRSITGGGFGYHVRKSPKAQIDLTGGLVWTHEHYSAIPVSATEPTAVPTEINNFLALDIGEQYTQKWGAKSSFTEEGTFDPDMNQLGQYRVNVNATLDTHITKVFGWQTTLNDIDVTNPPPGTRDNDIILTTGLSVSFAH
jgi:hypothetical protein